MCMYVCICTYMDLDIGTEVFVCVCMYVCIYVYAHIIGPGSMPGRHDMKAYCQSQNN